MRYVHDNKKVHRDIKPENILMQGDNLKLCDFGFVAPFGGNNIRLTSCGTWDYLSPEIASKK